MTLAEAVAKLDALFGAEYYSFMMELTRYHDKETVIRWSVYHNGEWFAQYPTLEAAVNAMITTRAPAEQVIAANDVTFT